MLVVQICSVGCSSMQCWLFMGSMLLFTDEMVVAHGQNLGFSCVQYYLTLVLCWLHSEATLTIFVCNISSSWVQCWLLTYAMLAIHVWNVSCSMMPNWPFIGAILCVYVTV